MFNMQDHTDAMKATGATVVAVGVGDKANQTASIKELKMIASTDQDNNPLYFTVDNFDNLDTYLDKISQAACKPGKLIGKVIKCLVKSFLFIFQTK